MNWTPPEDKPLVGVKPVWELDAGQWRCTAHGQYGCCECHDVTPPPDRPRHAVPPGPADEPIPDTERPDLVAAQPPPVPNAGPAMWDLVVADMRARDRFGRAEYATPLQAFNGRDPLVDAYQECLDQAVYLRQAIFERNRHPQPGDVYEWEGTRYVFRERTPGGSYAFDREDEPGPAKELVVQLIQPTTLAACGIHYVPPAIPHRMAMAQELRRLQAREQELLDDGRKLVDAKRDVDRQGMVRQFMRVFGQPISTNVGFVPHELTPSLHGFVGPELVRFRVRLVAEEFIEFLYATLDSPTDILSRGKHSLAIVEEAVMGLVDIAPIAVDLPEAIDATLDMDYVNQGFRDTFGVDTKPLWLAVHESNMAKAGPDGVPRRRPEDGKVLKPDGWKPPDIRGLLMAQGWRPTQDGE